MTEVIINKTALKRRARSRGCNVSEKSFEKLDALVVSIIDEACERSKANKRKTLLEYDF